MAGIAKTLDELKKMAEAANVHTIELAAVDTQGRLRGKRIPVDRYFADSHSAGANICEAIFVFDVLDDLPDNDFVNMDTGYIDCHLTPDNATGRLLTHRPGYALVFADTENEHGEPHELSPRQLLANQIERCRAAGLDPVVATELEFYLCTPDWERAQKHIQYSSLTDALGFESALADMREALLGAGIDVESSNAEYGPGQIEINVSYDDAMTTADNTVLFKSIVKQVAVQHGLRATFMPKPWADQSGSGMHVHTSLNGEGGNLFADCVEGEPNELMSQWLAGQMAHAEALTFLGTPNENGAKRIRPYTFCPSHIAWGLDNRTVLARCITEAGSQANRVEYRGAGADANPYLIIAGLLAAGLDGVENTLDPGPISEGDLYTNPGDAKPLPADLTSILAAYRGSALAQAIGEKFSTSYASISDAEVALAAENNPDPDDVNDWERQRFLEHS